VCNRYDSEEGICGVTVKGTEGMEEDKVVRCNFRTSGEKGDSNGDKEQKRTSGEQDKVKLGQITDRDKETDERKKVGKLIPRGISKSVAETKRDLIIHTSPSAKEREKEKKREKELEKEKKKQRKREEKERLKTFKEGEKRKQQRNLRGEEGGGGLSVRETVMGGMGTMGIFRGLKKDKRKEPDDILVSLILL
jgi:hypothetical protein